MKFLIYFLRLWNICISTDIGANTDSISRIFAEETGSLDEIGGGDWCEFRN
jgi:hypothetical protein